MDWITHDEDVWFEFRGSNPQQLTPGRYYRGEVDGFADFGVFVDLAPGVTGLLHRSELDRRLESLDWDAGDTVFVQVKNVRDNGNVDLGWSIRQSEGEFRGARVHDPDGDSDGEPIENGTVERDEPVRHRPERASEGATRGRGETEDEAGGGESSTETRGGESAAETTAEKSTTGEATTDAPDAAEPTAEEPERVAVETLEDRVGDRVRLEGRVVGVRQTSGPTVFELRDETGVAECAAFVEAGVRAYPDAEAGDVVRLDGEVERRYGDLQVETEALEVLDGDEAETVERRLSDALTDEARPDELAPLADHAPVDIDADRLLDAAEAVRRAVLESRPVVVRHAATADGYVAGAALERAVLPLVRREHAAADAEYHYFARRPLDDAVYGMDAATNDVTRMLQDRDRHDEKLPLVVLVGVGSTVESSDGLGLLGVYGAERVVVDAATADAGVGDEVEVLVCPDDAGDLSTGALSATLAATVNEDVRDDVAHLPAVSYWEDAPEAYVSLAEEAGYSAEEARELREAVALEAFYQSYEDKRELVSDLLFGDGPAAARTEGGIGLASHVSEQFRKKLDDEIETAQANLETREVDGLRVAVIDTDAFTHRFDFPPTPLLVDELHRRNRDDGPFVTLGLGMDELYLRSTEDLDVRAVAGGAKKEAPTAGIAAVGVREGRIEFLAGERDAVTEAVVDAVAEQLE